MLFRQHFTTSSHAAGCQRRRPLLVRASTSTQRTLHICTNKTCRRQGSPQILKFLKDLGLDELGVEECGCLGNCGKGPNMVLMPGEVRLRHVSTPADAIGLLQSMNINVDPRMLKATELRLAGNALAVDGDLQGAISKYLEALELNPCKGKHMLYSNLSATYLQLGQQDAAVQAARSSMELAPKGFHMAYVRLVDALYACRKFEEAAAVLQDAVAKDHTFKNIPEYKVMEQALKKYKPKHVLA